METETEGQGPALVLLHGGIGTGRFHWSRLVGPLAERFTVHLPDLPGHGRTPLPADGRYDREVLVEAIEAYLEPLAPAHVGGFSMGGQAVLALAARRPELFASLVLVGVSVAMHEGLDRWRDHFAPDRLLETFPLLARKLSRLHEPQGGPEAWRDVCDRDRAGLEMDVDLDALRALERPVLLVRGDRDSAVDPGQYATLREVWPQAAEFVVPAGGHDVQLTRHRIVRPGLLDFLDEASQEADGS